MRAVVLIGMRGSGKTTLGRVLASRLCWPCHDSDEVLAAAVGAPAGQWLAEAGEAVFRERERSVVEGLLAAQGPAVIATGGGAVTIAAVRRALMAQDLLTVWLQAPPAVLAARIAAGASLRPPLTSLGAAAEVAELCAQRAPLYAACARLVVDTGSLDVDAAAAAVLAAVRAAPRP